MDRFISRKNEHLRFLYYTNGDHMLPPPPRQTLNRSIDTTDFYTIQLPIIVHKNTFNTQ